MRLRWKTGELDLYKAKYPPGSIADYAGPQALVLGKLLDRSGATPGQSLGQLKKGSAWVSVVIKHGADAVSGVSHAHTSIGTETAHLVEHRTIRANRRRAHRCVDRSIGRDAGRP
jgi:hypothetical protein